MKIIYAIRRILSIFKNYQFYLFYLGKSSFAKTYLSFHPDSYLLAGMHPEFNKLFHGFIKNNKFNNSGDISRLWSLILNAKLILAENIEGDFAELGVWRGNSSQVLAFFARRAGKRIYLFDTFSGFDDSDLTGIDGTKDICFTDTSVSTVKDVIGESIDVCQFVEGHFPASAEKFDSQVKFSLVSLDCDLYVPMKAGLYFFYERMPVGGLFLLHDYSSGCWDGAKKAIDEFCKNKGEHLILMPDKSGSALLRKSH